MQLSLLYVVELAKRSHLFHPLSQFCTLKPKKRKTTSEMTSWLLCRLMESS